MKCSYLSFLGIIFLIHTSFAQEGIPFPTENAVWSVLFTQSGNTGQVFTTTHYAPIGDTIIQGDSYTKLFSNNGRGFSIDSSRYIGAYTSTEELVLFIKKGNLNPDTLYNFNLPIWTVLETFDCDTSNIGCDFFQLNSIDFISLDDNIERKRLNFNWVIKDGENSFSNSYSHSWIEGIGSTLGFFPDPYPLFSQTLPVDPVFFIDLLCFKLEDNLIYHHPDLFQGECFKQSTLSSSSQIKKKTLVNIYPNPAHNSIFLRSSNDSIFQEVNIKILDTAGRLLREEIINFNGNYEVDISGLPKGTYFVQISTIPSIETKRVLKTIIKL